SRNRVLDLDGTPVWRPGPAGSRAPAVRTCNVLRLAWHSVEPALPVWRPLVVSRPLTDVGYPVQGGQEQMAGQFGAQFEQMTAAASHVAEVNESVQRQLAGLRNQLAPLTGAWKGQAATAFAMLMERWDADARNLNEALSSIGEQIRGSGTTYAQADEEQR